MTAYVAITDHKNLPGYNGDDYPCLLLVDASSGKEAALAAFKGLEKAYGEGRLTEPFEIAVVQLDHLDDIYVSQADVYLVMPPSNVPLVEYRR